MTQLKGYMGKVLFIDLSERTFREFPWTDADRKRTLGGKIMAADILLKHITPTMKAFDEDNWLVITTGPLTGTGCPNTSRFNISTISPLTNILTSSSGDHHRQSRCADACAYHTGQCGVPGRERDLGNKDR